MEYCVYCGAELSPDDDVCPECGAEIVIRRPDVRLSSDNFVEVMEDGKSMTGTITIPTTGPDSANRVMSPLAFLASIVPLSLPFIGFILSVVWALGGCENRNRKNLATGYVYVRIILIATVTVIYLFMKMINPAALENILSSFESAFLDLM